MEFGSDQYEISNTFKIAMKNLLVTWDPEAHFTNDFSNKCDGNFILFSYTF